MASTLCTFRIGGLIHIVVEPRCVGELIAAVECCEQAGQAYAVIGRGSNILFGDGRIETVLIRTVALNNLHVESDGLLRAECGVGLGTLANAAAHAGLGGFSFACGIPGTVGGALFMNAGAHGKSVLDVVESVQIWDSDHGKIETLFNGQLNNSYRKSVFQTKNTVILQAVFRLNPRCESAALFDEMKALRAKRNAAQPVSQPSAGSVFRRPAPDIAVSRIVDELGLKGKRVGGAVVSEKHAGFIVNDGGATAKDVRDLIWDIQNIVERERGFRPMPELRFIPEDI